MATLPAAGEALNVLNVKNNTPPYKSTLCTAVKMHTVYAF